MTQLERGREKNWEKKALNESKFTLPPGEGEFRENKKGN